MRHAKEFLLLPPQSSLGFPQSLNFFGRGSFAHCPTYGSRLRAQNSRPGGQADLRHATPFGFGRIGCSWDKPESYSRLAERTVGFCNIDQPIVGRSLKPGEKTTSPVGYVRLHGRNYNEWFRERPDGEMSEQRYNYLYSEEELEPWLERIRILEGNASAIYTILNNHPDAKALVDAFQIIHGLTGKKLDIPEDMVERYPILEMIASSRPKAGFLF